MDLKAVGLRIKEAREAKNLTQENLAAIVDLSTTHISVIERGLKNCRKPFAVFLPMNRIDSLKLSVLIWNRYLLILIRFPVRHFLQEENSNHSKLFFFAGFRDISLSRSYFLIIF